MDRWITRLESARKPRSHFDGPSRHTNPRFQSQPELRDENIKENYQEGTQRTRQRHRASRKTYHGPLYGFKK